MTAKTMREIEAALADEADRKLIAEAQEYNESRRKKSS